jgi:hypothetical protein
LRSGTLKLYNRLDGPAEIPSDKYQYTYDDDNNLSSSVLFAWDSDEADWKEENKYEYEQDDRGNQTLETYYRWEKKNRMWQPYYKYGHTYNENNLLDEVFFYYRNVDTQDWKGQYKDEYQYDEYENPLSVFIYQWEENDWILSETGVYYYSGQTVEVGKTAGIGSVFIYPNPATDYVTLAGAGGTNIVIFDAAGRIICTKKNIGETEIIPTASWTSGVYFVTIQAGGKQLTKKIIKK